MMIKVNLIGTKVKPKPKAPAFRFYIFVGLILVEIVVLFAWFKILSSELEDATKKAKDAMAKVENLKRLKEEWEKWQAEKADLDRQIGIFETLKAEQAGPANMLEFLSYALTQVPDNPMFVDEAKAQELVGWNPKWDTRRVWLTKLEEKQGILTIKGEAIDHEDVAEFYKRLETCEYFGKIEPGIQSRKFSEQLKLKLVDFSATTTLQYAPPRQAQGEGGQVVGQK
jgi:Tfp pilus assembly protein PilN